MVRSAEAIHTARHAQEFGFSCGEVQVDLKAIQDRKDQISGTIVDRLISWLTSEDDIAIIKGTAAFRTPTQVQVGDRLLTAPHTIIATGSAPMVPPIAGVHETGYVTSDEMMTLRELPERFVVVGGGAVALEFAQMFARFGSQVTVLELLPRLLPQEDEEASVAIEAILRDEGLATHTSARVMRLARRHGHKEVVAEIGGQTHAFPADEVLIATGRRPVTDGLNLAAAGVQYDQHSGMVVDDELRTTAPHILTVGDCCTGYQFTHVAVYQGVLAVQNALNGKHEKVDFRVMPRATFTDPEVASVGLTEREALEAGYAIQVGNHPVERIGRARVVGETRGFLKFVCEAETGRILGAHFVAPHAGELIHNAVLAMNAAGGGVDLLVNAVFIHPTMAEGVQSAAEVVGSAEPARMSH